MKTNIMVAIAAIVASQAAAGATNDVVTAVQLNKVEQIAKSAQTNSNNNATAMGQVNVKVKGLEGDIKAIGNTASSAALKAAGADAKAVTATKIGNEAKRDASKAQATGVAAQGTANIAKLHADKLETQKVDVTVFEEDQRRQDRAVQANKDHLAGVDETLEAHDDAINNANVRIDTVSNTLTSETKNLWSDKASNADVDTQFKTESQSRETADDAITGRLSNETAERKADTSYLDSKVNTKVSTETFSADQRRQDESMADLSNSKADKAALAKTDARVLSNTTAIGDETLARESDVAGLENRKADKSQVAEVARAADTKSRSYAERAEKNAHAYTDSRFDAADQRISNLEHQQQQTQREVRSGVADVAAMANIPTAREIGRMNIGAGTGFYKNTAAVAVGGSYRFNSNVTVKGAFSSTGRDTVAGAGMSFEF